MKKIHFLIAVCSLLFVCACSTTCETEPIVEQNHKLIVPKNFGKMPG